jgi:predicted site-specific integrase-resolvase
MTYTPRAPLPGYMYASDAATLYGVSWATINRWITAGHVERRRQAGDPRTLVKISDMSRAIRQGRPWHSQ